MPLSSLTSPGAVLGADTTLRRLRTFGLWFLVMVDAAFTVTAWDHRHRLAAGEVVAPGSALSGTATLLSLLAMVVSLAVIWRRTYPVALTASGVAVCIVASLGPTLALIGLMSVIIGRDRSTAIKVAPVVALATGVGVWRDVYTEPASMSFWGSMVAPDGPPSWYAPVLLTALLLGLFGGVGLWLRTRADLSTAHGAVAEEREHVNTLTDRLSRQAERERIAREIHDGLGHNLSILSIHANALEAMADATADSTSRPEDGRRMATQLRESALVVRQQAAQTVTELHGLLDILRNPDDPDMAAPTKTLRDVRALVDESVTAGMPLVATVFVEGSEDADPHVAQAAYRIVQELLTNARKHVPTVPVRLSVTGGPGEGALTIATANHVPPPRGPGQPHPERGRGGTGLSGIRERVERYGGQMSAGVDPDGVFRVSVRLPWAPPEATARREERGRGTT